MIQICQICVEQTEDQQSWPGGLGWRAGSLWCTVFWGRCCSRCSSCWCFPAWSVTGAGRRFLCALSENGIIKANQHIETCDTDKERVRWLSRALFCLFTPDEQKHFWHRLVLNSSAEICKKGPQRSSTLRSGFSSTLFLSSNFQKLKICLSCANPDSCQTPAASLVYFCHIEESRWNNFYLYTQSKQITLIISGWEAFLTSTGILVNFDFRLYFQNFPGQSFVF